MRVIGEAAAAQKERLERCRRIEVDLYAQLRQARTSQGISKAVLSDALGLTGMSVKFWEDGASASAGNLVMWAEALGRRVIIADGRDRRCAPPRPVPRARGEEVDLYRVRCLASTLRGVRTSQALTQQQVGEQLAVSAWTVQMWEGGRRVPRVLRLIAWCDVLQCRLALAT